MGIVYRAVHLPLGRIVALKMIHPGKMNSANIKARLELEAKSAARLDDNGIVQIHDIFEDQGRLFLSLEYVDGMSLDLLWKNSPQPIDRVAGIVERVARAIHAAHVRGVIHRDLKPGNILVARDGSIKVTDFGLAKLLDGTENLTGSGCLAGTPYYMSPEQTWPWPEWIGPQTDVFALGAILYEGLSGRTPFDHANAPGVFNLICHHEPPDLRVKRPDLPRDLDIIVRKCLEKHPTHRYQSSLELAEDLSRFRHGNPIIARSAGLVGQFRGWARRNPRFLWWGAFLWVIATFASLAMFWNAYRALEMVDHLRNRELRLMDLMARMQVTLKDRSMARRLETYEPLGGWREARAAAEERMAECLREAESLDALSIRATGLREAYANALDAAWKEGGIDDGGLELALKNYGRILDITADDELREIQRETILTCEVAGFTTVFLASLVVAIAWLGRRGSDRNAPAGRGAIRLPQPPS